MTTGGEAAARLATLAVRDFRNLARLELEPPREGLVVVGDNGHGKTNLLEAIYYLQIFRSARGARDQDLVRFGADAFHIRATADTDRCHEIAVGFERGARRKRVRLDGAIAERLSDAVGALPSVMFSPGDVELVGGAPAARRRFLDIMLAVTTPRYLAALQHYRGALVRRNAALRAAARGGPSGADAVAVWEPPLAEYGAVLWAARHAWVAGVEGRFEETCRAIGEPGRVRVRYATSIVAADEAGAAGALALALEQKRGIDLRRGLTHAGPHRDDLLLSIDGRDLRVFGSAGQQRSAAIGLRMLEAATLRDRTGRAPLFLLDDPFAELDLHRASRILELLEDAGLGQTVLAVPRESDIPRELTRLDRFRITNGELGSLSA